MATRGKRGSPRINTRSFGKLSTSDEKVTRDKLVNTSRTDKVVSTNKMPNNINDDISSYTTESGENGESDVFIESDAIEDDNNIADEHTPYGRNMTQDDN
jgi:hypothetical protein